jgi:hypothetical protein
VPLKAVPLQTAREIVASLRLQDFNLSLQGFQPGSLGSRTVYPSSPSRA